MLGQIVGIQSLALGLVVRTVSSSFLENALMASQEELGEYALIITLKGACLTWDGAIEVKKAAVVLHVANLTQNSAPSHSISDVLTAFAPGNSIPTAVWEQILEEWGVGEVRTEVTGYGLRGGAEVRDSLAMATKVGVNREEVLEQTSIDRLLGALSLLLVVGHSLLSLLPGITRVFREWQPNRICWEP
jgi:hypothetical protein